MLASLKRPPFSCELSMTVISIILGKPKKEQDVWEKHVEILKEDKNQALIRALENYNFKNATQAKVNKVKKLLEENDMSFDTVKMKSLFCAELTNWTRDWLVAAESALAQT